MYSEASELGESGEVWASVEQHTPYDQQRFYHWHIIKARNQ